MAGARGAAVTYCEMGIDVRAYAMANLDVKRAACVGCGMCAHVSRAECSGSRTRLSVGRPGSRSGCARWICKAALQGAIPHPSVDLHSSMEVLS